MNVFIWVILVIWLVVALIFIFVKKAPHGWVQFRTGLVLRFLPGLDSAPVLQIRDSIEAFVVKKMPQIKSALPVDKVEDIEIPTRYGQISARIYQLDEQKSDKLIVLIHGGGFCIGSTNTYEEVSRRLVRQTGQPLISLNYSLAPEAKFPQGHEECVDALTWLCNQREQLGFANRKFVLVGDSAGGNLVITTLYDVDASVRAQIDSIVPVYPVVDHRRNDYQSSIDYAEGHYLTKKAMQQFTEAFISQQTDMNDIRLSPIYHDPINDYPRTFVLTAEFDPLRDQAEAYALKLKEEGVSVKLKRYSQTIHAFFGLKDFGSQGVQAIKDIALFLEGEEIKSLSKFS